MSEYRLGRIYKSRFIDWVTRSGFQDEFTFWQSLSSLTEGTHVDHMDNYLGSLGYVGNPDDKFRKFLRDQTSLLGTTFDMGNQFFDTAWSAGASGDPLTTEGGANLTTEDGQNILTE